MQISSTPGIFLERCEFPHNQGSTVHATASAGDKLNVTKCHFAENNLTETTFLAFGGHPVGAHHSSLIIYSFLNCTCVRNYAYDGGQLMLLEQLFISRNVYSGKIRLFRLVQLPYSHQ